jgi:hypothetical protein
VARVCAWWHTCRRILVRDDYDADHDLGYVGLGGMVILLRWSL